jgi:Secretion system C-terminal sorting domain/Putative Ig domain
MFNNGTSIEDTLIDAASTAGMALDYIHADTSLSAQLSLAGSAMLVSSRTKGIIGMVTSYLNPDGTIISSIDTTLTSYFNAVAPVGGVLVKNNNQLEYWVADNSQNKLLRLSLSSYSITPTLPAGLIFNSVTGVIEGTPTTVTASQTYTLTIYGSSGYTSTSTFTLGVTPSNSVSNTTGTTSSTTNQTDGTTKNYIDDQNCTQLVVVTDFVGGTSPGQTRVEQTVTTASMVTVGNSNFVRRVTNIQAQQTESLNAKITFFYTYKDIKDFNTANPTNTFTNDTLAGSMQIYMLHMHETFDTLNRAWRKVPTYYGPLFALWIPNKHVWETSTNITKLSEFYAHPSSIASTFDCKNSGKDTIVANDFYVWNYPDSLFASGDYVDTLINHTGCDSIVQLHLTINITTGLNEAALNSGISVFPNPSNGVFNIRFNNAVIMPSKVRVISVLGTEVMNKTITSSDSIDLSSFQSGIYYLLLESEGTTKTWRIVKQ